MPVGLKPAASIHDAASDRFSMICLKQVTAVVKRYPMPQRPHDVGEPRLHWNWAVPHIGIVVHGGDHVFAAPLVREVP